MKHSHVLQSSWGRRLMTVNLLSGLASNLCAFVLPWEILQRTGQVGWAVSSVGLTYLGQVLFSVPLGSWADRHPRQKSIQLLLGMSIIPSIIFILALSMTSGAGWLWVLLAAQATLVVLGSAVGSAVNAAAQNQDQENTTASVAALTNSRQVSWFAGQALGAWLVALGGAAAAPAASALLLAVALVCSWGLPHMPSADGHILLRRKLRELLRLPGLWPITLLGSSWNLAAGALTASVVPWLSENGFNSGQMGWVYLFGAGGSVAAGAALHWMTRTKASQYLCASLAAWAAAVFAYSVSGSVLLTVLVAWFLVMLCNTSLAGLVSGLRAGSIPPRLMIAGSQLTMLVRISFFTVGGVSAGLIAGAWGVSMVPPICGLWVLLLCLPGAWVQKRLRELEGANKANSRQLEY